MKKLEDDVLKKFGKGKKKDFKKGGRAVIYLRVSSKDQENGFSLETQEERCYEWAKREQFMVVKCFGGAHESAKSDIKRKRFNKMLEFVKNKKNQIDAIIVYEISRFTRTGNLGIIEELKDMGIVVFSVMSSYDARTITGEYVQGVEVLGARLDNRAKAQRVRDNGAKALRSGRWIQHPPLGYDMKTTKKEQEITVNEDGKLICQAFKMKVEENLTNEEIRIRMKSKGLDKKKQQWSKIFNNIFYAGYFAHAFLEGDIVRGPHEPLVSLENFMKINGILSKAHISGYEVKLAKEYAPLLGTLKCPICGHNLTSYLSTKMKKKYGKEIGYYSCSRKTCKCNVPAQKVNQLFREWLDGVAFPKSGMEILQAQLKKAFPILNRDGINEVKAIKANLTKKEEELEKAKRNFSAEDDEGRGIIKEEIRKIKAEREEILQLLEERDNSISNLGDYVDFGLSIKDNMLKLWELGDLCQKKRMQNLIFPEGLVYNKENDNIEPVSKNEFVFLFDLISENYVDKKKKQVIVSDNLSPSVHPQGLEPWTH